MLKLYHVTGTRSVRPLWLCYELNLPVTVERIDFSSEYRSSPEWRAISPAGKVPILTDGAVTMFESGAMVDYILERFGHGRLRPPPGTPESAMYHQWCWFAEATLSRPLGLSLLRTGREHGIEAVLADAQTKVRDCLHVVDEALADRDYLLGDQFGAADIMMGYSLALASNFNVLDDRYPRARTYLDRLKGRDACKRAMSE